MANKKLPTVAIIGRANAGKSSLFNRIFGSQEAIVAREAGTTRDNVVRQITTGQHSFWLVDTAGLKNAEDDFEASIQEQISEAADVADVIIVMVDGTEYPDDEERAVAKKALRSKKPVILAINKSDLKGSLPEDEFKRLGIKTMIRISAEHNRGVSSLIELVKKDLPEAISTEDDNVLRVALIGRPNVGKSHLFNTLAGKQQAVVANIAGTTRDINRLRIRFQSQTIELLDTAGVRKPGKQEVGIEKFSVLRTLQAIEEADVCFLLIDVNDLHVQLDQKLAGIVKEAGKGLVIVVSKWDSVEGKDAYTRDALAPQISYNFAFVPWAPLIFTSAVTGQNVAKLFELAMDIKAARQQTVKTSDLNKLLARCLTRHPAAGLKNRHPKLRYLVQTDTNPPWFVLFGSHLGFLHWSYKRYLEHELRETFGYQGTSIKISYRDEKQIKANKERVAQGLEPITKKSKQIAEDARKKAINDAKHK
jgi:GTP-binding protein